MKHVPTTDPTTPRAALPEQMRVMVARDYGTPEVLSVEVVPVPAPSDTELLVLVEASSLNALDWRFLTGTPYLLRPSNGLRRPKRQIPGVDVAGTVVATGSRVTRFRPGDTVFGECAGGGCAPYVSVDETTVVAKPAEVSFVAAGATPLAGLTALQALRTHGRVRPGQRVLVNGAAGGVGTFAVQIAAALGANVTAVCSDRNAERARSLGADTVIDYASADFVDGGARFDVLIDGVGNRSPADCLSVLRPGGRLVAISGPMTNRWLGPVPHMIATAMACRRADVTFHQFTATTVVEDLEFLARLLAAGDVAPAIDRLIGLDGIARGLVELGTGHAPAKIVVTPTW